ncbi:hypothetical protein AB0F91_25885 [Amycolatopsis sp. NPDC023774]|uniref:hypothetical protein n=1 Tax=Amycolatopsis sp. NPDC023774 TaxID=3155015 RepID=UPI0033DF3C55
MSLEPDEITTRIGDRDKPLSDKTMARIEAGLRKFTAAPQIVTAGGSWNDATQPADIPLRTLTTREANALLVPMEGREGKHAASTGVPMRTQTARHETALVVPYYSTLVAHPVDTRPTMSERTTTFPRCPGARLPGTSETR